ncbi:MAG: DUF5615 family PIN-like protein [Tepidisphaeraceae bacterium]
MTKLLIDENLSPKLARQLSDLFPGSESVRDLNLQQADDVVIWRHAQVNGHVIVTKDVDLYARSLLFGHPPKVIRIELGNCSTTRVETLLRWRADRIRTFIADDDAACLALR